MTTMQTLTLPQHYHGRRFYSLDAYLKNTFGEKLYKLSLSGGMTCPNRDGTIAFGGCIFCSEGGSGDFAADSSLPVSEQIESAKKTIGRKFDGNRYIAYFQSFTNTYQSVSYLERLFFPVIEREEIACLSIATRPDCLEEDKLRLLQRLNRIKPVWVELGLQTIHPETAALIRRGYPLNTYDTAVKHLKEIGVQVIVHMILGLPQEKRNDMLETAAYIGKSGAHGIKLQLLHVLRNTALAEMYQNRLFSVLTEDEYIDILTDIIALLPQDMVIHRLTGDGGRDQLIAPKWSGDKRHVLNRIHHELKQKGVIQGCRCTMQTNVIKNV